MKVMRARVQNFRSIVDSGVFEIEPSVTVLIGRNEQGKTNLLKALRSFNKSYKYAAGDLPNHLLPTLTETDAAKVPIVALWLTIEPTDRTAVARGVRDTENIKELKITKFLDGHYEYEGIKEEGTESALTPPSPDIAAPTSDLNLVLADLRQKIAAHASRLPTLAPHAGRADQLVNDFAHANFYDPATLDNLFETFIAGLRSLPGQDGVCSKTSL